jgi:hypothetical protein
VKVLFVVGFGPIVPDVPTSRRLYGETLGLPLEGDATYLHTGAVEGVKEFALWPLSGAAESCFGTTSWPADVPVPSAWMEFDVEDIDEASRELEERGYRLLVSSCVVAHSARGRMLRLSTDTPPRAAASVSGSCDHVHLGAWRGPLIEELSGRERDVDAPVGSSVVRSGSTTSLTCRSVDTPPGSIMDEVAVLTEGERIARPGRRVPIRVTVRPGRDKLVRAVSSQNRVPTRRGGSSRTVSRRHQRGQHLTLPLVGGEALRRNEHDNALSRRAGSAVRATDRCTSSMVRPADCCGHPVRVAVPRHGEAEVRSDKPTTRVRPARAGREHSGGRAVQGKTVRDLDRSAGQEASTGEPAENRAGHGSGGAPQAHGG